MSALDEEAFRALLDERGFLRSDAWLEPKDGSCLTVFSQEPGGAFDVARWSSQAERFFDARVGLSVPKRYHPAEPPRERDAAHVLLATTASASYRRMPAQGTRLVMARPAHAGDFDRAARAEAGSHGRGLALLAQRCPRVFLLVCQDEPANDRVALRLAAILASVGLGPIIGADGSSVFGVRTARERLDALESGR